MSEDNVEFLDGVPEVEEPVTEDQQPMAEESPAVETETQEPESESEQPEEEEHKEKRKGGYQRRIERLERQNQELLDKLLKQTETPKPEPVISKDLNKPNPDDFEDHLAYLEALTDYKVEQREKQREAMLREQETKRSAQTQEQAFNAKLKQAAETHADFNDLFEEHAEEIPATPTMAQAVVESELGSELLYYFLSNPKEAQKVAALNPIAAAIAIGKIEAKLEKIEAKEPKPKSTTQAPKPPSPVKAAPVTPRSDDGKVDFY